MMRINLLPWRARARKQRQREFILMVIIGILLSAIAVVYWYWHSEGLIEHQKERNRYLQQEMLQVTQQIKAIKDLEKTKQQLISRMQIVTDLQTSRPQIVHLFDELVEATPDGVHLTEVAQNGNEVTILGLAQSNTRISAYMRNIATSPWLDLPQLQIIEQQSAGKDRDVSRFKLTLQQVVPNQEGAK